MGNKIKKPKIYLVAGGTGGHIYGAIALSELISHYQVFFISSQRDIDKKLLHDYPTTHLPARALKGRGIGKTFINSFWNIWVMIRVMLMTLVSRPKLVIGLGGFICGPSLLACWLLGIPVYIVEQNSVMGMANRLLLPFCKKVYTSFEKVKGLPKKYQDKIEMTGNPIRGDIRYHFKEKYEVMNILIFGGSLGAEEINDVVFNMLNNLDEKMAINIRHQVGRGKEKKIIIANDNIQYQQVNYIENMDQAYQWADGIICRGGASTISELRIVKKPSFIFPYPHKDLHQKFNAENLKQEVDFLVEYVEPKWSRKEKEKHLKEFLRKVKSIKPVNYSLINEDDPRQKILESSGVIL